MKNRRNVLYIVKDKEAAQFRYRVNNVAEVVDGRSVWRVRYCMIDNIGDLKSVLGDVDLIVISRQVARGDELLRFIKKIQAMNVAVLFDLDDLVFNYWDLLILMWSIRSWNVFYWFGYCWGVRRIAKKVDGFICTNEFLASKLKQSFGKPVKVIRNSLNKRQTEVSEKYLQDKKHDGSIIGYFSGSPTHIKDFGLVEPELIRFLENHDDAKLRIVGYMKFSGLMKKLIKEGRVEIVAPVDYLKLQKLIAEVDVNIAPLVINDFTNCKSELKFFEAAVVETTTIASPTYTFKNAIKDGENGFLAQPGEWYDKLEYLYNNPEENKKIAKKAKDYALKHYYGEEFLKEVEKAYDYFAK